MDDMMIRRATAADIPQIDELLRQVLEVHHAGRPDLFKGGVKKYTDEELKAILANDQTPVFVAVAPSANDGTDVEHNADSPPPTKCNGIAPSDVCFARFARDECDTSVHGYAP
ncbi:hypothetical protein GS08_08110 [Bifidobacterium longum]|uniref:Acetyltransferase n=2 Tax=Bifidobacterium longum TaxID=216816 RepID=A0A7U4KE92_BIFLN|nr:hypothetical protein BLJ_1559 [Bifidobacterium longum subsp. longum JDM301]AIF91067.1 hypothetical protein GS08_08110 [Bifidobacterium longum]